jgi:hypothetical protein
MATALKLRRGTTAQHASFTGSAAEVTVDTDKNTVVVHNGSTAGGFPLVRNGGNENVGIGTSSPGAKLQVNGTQTITGGGGPGSANGLHLYFNTSTNTCYLNGFNSGVDWRPIIYNGANHTWQTTDVERMRLDSSGNLGLGATPTAGAVHMDISTGGSVYGLSTGIQLAGNARFNAGNWQYRGSGKASRIDINESDSGGMSFQVASASGTAGNAITFTEMAKITTNGLTYAMDSPSGVGLNVISVNTFNNSSANNIGAINYGCTLITINQGNGATVIPFFMNGGGGIAWQGSMLDPDNGNFVHGSGPTVSFTSGGTSGNTYSVSLVGGVGNGTVQRTSGSAAYTVVVQRLIAN